MESKQAQALATSIINKLPVSLVVYLILKGLLSEADLESREEDLKTYAEEMILAHTPESPKYLQALLDTEIKPRGGLSSNEVMAPYIDTVLFKKYLYEKNPKFASIYRSSTALQSRADCSGTVNLAT